MKKKKKTFPRMLSKLFITTKIPTKMSVNENWEEDFEIIIYIYIIYITHLKKTPTFKVIKEG